MNEVYEIDGEKYHYNGKNWVDCYNCVAPLVIQQKLKAMVKKDTVATRLKKPLKPINTVTLKVSPKQDTKNCIEHLKNLGYGYDYSTKVYFIHYYVPKKFRNEHAASRDSQRILELKDKYRSAIDYYAGLINADIFDGNNEMINSKDSAGIESETDLEEFVKKALSGSSGDGQFVQMTLF